MEILIVTGLGLIIGSFLNVCIYRIPREESIYFPPSHCTSCGHRLGFWDLFPLLSFICLRGKCRYCHEKISLRYPGVELLNGVLYGLIIWRFGLTIEGIMALGFVSVVIVLTLIDIDHMLLPTSITMVGAGIAIFGHLMQSLLYKDWSILIESLLGGALGYGLFMILYYLCLWVLKKEGMGYGDVEYLGMLGLFTSPIGILLILLISSIVGALFGVALYWVHKESRPFPFGPFLSLGGLVTLLWSDQILQWYLGYLNLYI